MIKALRRQILEAHRKSESRLDGRMPNASPETLLCLHANTSVAVTTQSRTRYKISAENAPPRTDIPPVYRNPKPIKAKSNNRMPKASQAGSVGARFAPSALLRAA